MEALVAAGDVAEGQGVGVFAVIKNGGGAPGKRFGWADLGGGVKLTNSNQQEDTPDGRRKGVHRKGEWEAVERRGCAARGMGEG